MKPPQVDDSITFENQNVPRENPLMGNLAQPQSNFPPVPNYNMQAAYSINPEYPPPMRYQPNIHDPTLVGERGDYDPYAGMDPALRVEAEAKRKREINEILGMIDEMRMSDDSDNSDPGNQRKKVNKKRPPPPPPN